MGKVIINPGTFDVEENPEQARKNIEAFVNDIGGQISIERDKERDYGGGRYCFMLTRDEVTHEVQMPASPLCVVRGECIDNVFQQPRLYVDGNSWLWGFALNICDFEK